MTAWLPQVDSSIVLDGLKSLLLLLSVLIARPLIVRSIARNSGLTMEAKRRWVVTVRNTMVFIFLLGLMVIWAHELQAFAVSLVALAAALVADEAELAAVEGAEVGVGEALGLPQAADSKPKPTNQARDGRIRRNRNLHRGRGSDRATDRPPCIRLARQV